MRPRRDHAALREWRHKPGTDRNVPAKQSRGAWSNLSGAVNNFHEAGFMGDAVEADFGFFEKGQEIRRLRLKRGADSERGLIDGG